MKPIALIGGSGFAELEGLSKLRNHAVETPYGAAALMTGCIARREVVFLLRHGIGHQRPPHRINYRANIWALKDFGAEKVIAFNAVGGIRSDMAPGALALPHQIIDYTYGREHSFFTGDEAGVAHVDFTTPFSEQWRLQILRRLTSAGFTPVADGVYGCTQGPRLETAAEIKRMRRDGCDMVGMTAMPEAALARELELAYASIAISVNWAAGLSAETITMEGILQVLHQRVRELQSAFPVLLDCL